MPTKLNREADPESGTKQIHRNRNELLASEPSLGHSPRLPDNSDRLGGTPTTHFGGKMSARDLTWCGACQTGGQPTLVPVALPDR